MFSQLKITSKSKLTFGGYLPPNVVAYSVEFEKPTLMWFTPPMKKMMHFNDSAGTPNGIRIVPGLVWLFSDHLRLYAYKEWKGKATELYKAPFFNISGEGVCLGNANSYIKQNINRYTFEGIMETVQDAFFDSNFTHGSGHNQVKGNFNNLMKITMENIDQYPYQYLVPCDKTVNQLAENIFKA